MKDVLSKLWYLFNRSDKYALLLLFVLILFGTVLELLGIGAIIPFITMLAKPEVIEESVYIKFVYDVLKLSSREQFVIVAGVGIVLIYLFKNAYLLFSIYVQTRFLNSRYYKFSSALYKSYLRSPYSFHLQRNSAQLLRNVGLVLSVIQGVLLPLLLVFTEGAVILAVFVFLMLINPFSTIFVSISLGLILIVFYLVIRKKIKVLGEKRQYHSGKVIQHVNQGLGGIKETKVLGRTEYFEKQYNVHLEKITNITRHQQIVTQMPRYFVEVLTITTVVSLMIGLLFVGKDMHYVLATLSLFAVAAFRLIPSINRIGTSMATIRFYVPSLNEVYNDLINYNKFCKDPNLRDSGVALEFNKKLEIKDLCFRYERAKNFAINGLSLNIAKNSTVGIVGPSGSGKTTLIDIMLGLFHSEKGEILLDSVDISKNISVWQKKIGYIPQQIYLTDDTIKKNIAFGIPDDEISYEKVINAIKKAQLDEYIEGLPDNIETLVGENGARMSGGQRQRIGIARALYNDPEIIIMDEATSSLDNETERAFIDAIKRLSGKKTIIIIAHRLSTVKDCDRIHFLKEGRRVASGTYEELERDNREFRKMVSSDLSSQKDQAV